MAIEVSLSNAEEEMKTEVDRFNEAQKIMSEAQAKILILQGKIEAYKEMND